MDLRTSLIAGVLGMTMATGALAQASRDQGGPEELEKVVITATKLEEQLPSILEGQGIRVDTITADQIAKGGYLDVAQSLQMLAPGLYVSPKNGPFDYVDISLLGSRTSDVLCDVVSDVLIARDEFRAGHAQNAGMASRLRTSCSCRRRAGSMTRSTSRRRAVDSLLLSRSM